MKHRASLAAALSFFLGWVLVTVLLGGACGVRAEESPPLAGGTAEVNPAGGTTAAPAEPAGGATASAPSESAGFTVETEPEFVVEEEGPQACPTCPEVRFQLGGYFESEVAFDTVQDTPQEDMIDYRAKIFGHASYKFSDRTRLHLSIRTLYWLLEGGSDRQQTSFDLYECYLSVSLNQPAMDLSFGQILVRWARVGHIFSPTNVVNPINYSSFIDPDTEDLRIPLPMVRAQFYGEKYTVETIYIPIFQSGIFELTGTDLSLFKNQGKGKGGGLGSKLNPFLETITAYPARKVDFQEPKILTGEFGLKYSYDTGHSQVELIYFSTREDFPVIQYTEAKDITVNPESGSIKLAFDRYSLYGLVYRSNFSGVDLTFEYAGSPLRSLTKAQDLNHDGTTDHTRRVQRPWQAYALELDYLDPNQKYIVKLGVERSTYLNPPTDLIFSSADTTIFLFVFQLKPAQTTLTPEWRVINIQTDANQWFLSPRLNYKFKDKYSATAGLNVFIGAGGGPGGGNAQEFSPMTILSDNNQVFFSFRTSF